MVVDLHAPLDDAASAMEEQLSALLGHTRRDGGGGREQGGSRGGGTGADSGTSSPSWMFCWVLSSSFAGGFAASLMQRNDEGSTRCKAADKSQDGSDRTSHRRASSVFPEQPHIHSRIILVSATSTLRLTGEFAQGNLALI